MSTTIISKHTAPKIDPRHPESTDPDYKGDRAKALEYWPKMEKEFQDEGEKREYLKAVASNPNNMLGAPALYPPQQIKSFIHKDHAAVECECGGCCTVVDYYICPRCGKPNANKA